MSMIDSLIPDVFYISGYSLLLLTIFYLPIVIYILRLIWKKTQSNQKIMRAVTVFLSVTLLLSIPFGDVYLDSIKMERLCKEEAGTHIYKTVKVDGFYSDVLDEYRLKYGYSYSEGKYKGKLYRIHKVGDEVVQEEIKKIQSRYMLDNDRQTLKASLEKTRRFIVDKSTSEILAERLDFLYHGGWLDRYTFFNWLGYRPIGCDIPLFNLSDFYLNVLNPFQSESNGGVS